MTSEKLRHKNSMLQLAPFRAECSPPGSPRVVAGGHRWQSRYAYDRKMIVQQTNNVLAMGIENAKIEENARKSKPSLQACQPRNSKRLAEECTDGVQSIVLQRLCLYSRSQGDAATRCRACGNLTKGRARLDF